MSAFGREANGSFPINSAVRTPTLAVVKHMIDDTHKVAGFLHLAHLGSK